MSSLTHLESGPATRASGAVGVRRERIITPPLALVFISSFASLTSFYLLLSVTPMVAASAGAGSSVAGLVTGALLFGTVLAELAVSALMKRFRYRTLLLAGAALMGLPALALLAGGRLVIVIVLVSLVRGFGFGLGTVESALTAMLLPPERRGEGLGLYGVVDSLPGVIALPSGVWLAGHYGYATVVLMAAVIALVPLALFRWLPGTADPRSVRGGGAGPGQEPGIVAVLRHRGERRLALIFAATTVAAGVVVSFLPLAAGAAANVAAIGLLAQALTATIGRWWAGRHGDRHGHTRLLVPGLAIASCGMAAMAWPASPAAVIAGMCLFGLGFGIIQNATIVLMIDRIPSSGVGAANAAWNLAYDTGYGAGPAVFGLLAGHIGYPAVFVLTSLIILTALPAGARERSRPRSR